jgi:hypothetical protein
MRVADGSLPPNRALILNVGYQEHSEQFFSEDGLDKLFQCNYLFHWVLTLMLLRAWTRSTDEEWRRGFGKGFIDCNMYSLALTGISIQRRQNQQTKCALINPLIPSFSFFFSPFRFDYSLTPTLR